MFDISKLGEKSNRDLINRFCEKFHPQDRLAWNMSSIMSSSFIGAFVAVLINNSYGQYSRQSTPDNIKKHIPNYRELFKQLLTNVELNVLLLYFMVSLYHCMNQFLTIKSYPFLLHMEINIFGVNGAITFRNATGLQYLISFASWTLFICS